MENRSEVPTPPPDNTPVVAPMVSSPIPESPNSKPQLLFVLMGIMGIIIALGGSFYLGMHTERKNQVTINPKNVTPSTFIPSPSAIATKDETVNWPTYEKKELGIKINYPPGWFILSNPGGYSIFVSPIKIDMPYPSDGIPAPISINANFCTDTTTNQQYPCEKTIEERAEKIKQTFSLQNVQERSFPLLGKVAYQVSGTAGDGNPLSGQYLKETMVDRNNYILVSTLYEKKYEEQYDKIVSSFELKNIPTSSSWNTKQIQKVNWGDWKSFTLSYPSSWSIEINRTSYSDMENLNVYLKKGTYSMRFLQAPSDAGSCLYPGDTPNMGMEEEYSSYTEIPKTNGIIWRNSKLKNYQSNFPGYTVCEKRTSANIFVGMTSIGIINLLDTSNTFSPETISEVNEILRKIEITN